MKKVLFIDRDGTIIKEPIGYQIDAIEKLDFLPHAIGALSNIRKRTDYLFSMVTNQDGLGTDVFPESTFWPIQETIIKILASEGVIFDTVHIDKSFPEEQLPTRKPRTGMLKAYFFQEYDLAHSFVIGDRITDVELAKNLGCKAIYMAEDPHLGINEIQNNLAELHPYIALQSTDWHVIERFLIEQKRQAKIERHTHETQIKIELYLDGQGFSNIHTGLHFFDHMLDQLAKHSGMDLHINVKGDLHVDEHHTIEDTAIALGEAFYQALQDKRGLMRYGFCLPMDDCLAQVAIDFGGRPWIEWNVIFNREKIGDMPTEMFYHFFKSFSDAAKCNLNVQATGTNEHHKIESIFKALAKAIGMATKVDIQKNILPSTKGML